MRCGWVFSLRRPRRVKRGKGRGFSGVQNDLFVDPKTSMLFGDARQSLLDLGLQVKEA
jgi:NAD(P) transhydrogenase subunit beta